MSLLTWFSINVLTFDDKCENIEIVPEHPELPPEMTPKNDLKQFFVDKLS